MRGLDDLEVDKDVVDNRRAPGPRLNSRFLTDTDGFAGMPRRTIPFAFFLDEDMAVSGKGAAPSHVLKEVLIYLRTRGVRIVQSWCVIS